MSEVKVAQDWRRRRAKPEKLPMLVETNGPMALSPEIIQRKPKVVPLSSLKVHGMQLSSADNAPITDRDFSNRPIGLKENNALPYASEAVAADLNVSFESLCGQDSNQRHQLGSFDNTNLIRTSVESLENLVIRKHPSNGKSRES